MPGDLRRGGEVVDRSAPPASSTSPPAHPRCIVRVFGGMGVDVDGEPVSIGGARQRRLLALLVIRSGTVVTLDWLAEHLWTDDERPQEFVPQLRTYLSRLRRAFPESARDWIATESGGYRFEGPDSSIEHRRFEALRVDATQARQRDDPLAAIAPLDEALALWRGDPFRELEDFDWARATIEQLKLERLEMYEERWEVALALGKHTQITGELAAFTAEHGLRDRAVRQHSLALHRSGRTTEALRVLDRHRRQLADESGLEPSAAVVELEAAMLAGDASVDAPDVGRPLRGYRLLEEIGNGAFSVVWRGIQPSVGRDVAIKQIRSELASQPEFIRRFEAEAQMVATIEHPHVVPLIDFWRDPDSAYLVMRWLRGGTLERRLDDGPLTVAQTMTVARQVGSALASAHAQGVVHRDVKPANILFDHEDNAFLTDFGIALDVAATSGPEAALSPGSPAYAAPEQIRYEALGPEADVYSFGVVLSECVDGETMPDSMATAIRRATAEDANDRFGSIKELLDALDPELSPDARSTDGEALPTEAESALQSNPYKGLRAFDVGDSGDFFGRERLTHELVTRLSGTSIQSRCVIVVGPSGSGKSSVVRAGVVPAVRSGAVDGSAEWFTSTMVPGEDPYRSLEEALLRVAVDPPASLLSQLHDGERGILRGVRRCLGADDARVLLLVDQFEELFTGSAAAHADDFLNALSVAIHEPSSPLRLVVTIRADYYDRPLAHPAFAPIVKACAVDVTPLAGDELARAIVEPARRAGVEFEPGLVARIAAETAGRPAALPLLQYTLHELWARRAGPILTTDTYDEIGGLSGALAARAEEIYRGCDDVQRAAIRTMFGRMTDPSGEAADIRRRVPLADIGTDPSHAALLDRLGSARLITFGRDVGTREPTVEVAHEALLREWPRLVGWLEEDLDLLRSAAGVAAAANAWDEAGRDETDVYQGFRLDNAVDLARTAPDRLRALDRDFIEASQLVAESARRTEEQRLRRLRRLVAGVGVALVLALIAGGLALRQSSRADDEARRAQAAADDAAEQARVAEDQTRIAEAQTAAAVRSAAEAELATLISRSAAQVDDNPDLAVLLALEAHRRSPRAETEQAVLTALGSSTFANRVSSLPPLNGSSGDCPRSLANADGTAEFGVLDGQLVSRDPLTGVVTDHGPSPAPCVRWLGDAQANRRVVVSDDGRRMWLGPFTGPFDVVKDFDVATLLVSRSFNDEHRLLFESQGVEPVGTVLLIDDETGEAVGEPITGGTGFNTAVTSADGSLIAASFLFNFRPEGSGLVVVADGATGEELLRIDTQFHLELLAIDKTTGELVAGSDQSSSITTFDLATGDIVAEVGTTSTAGRPEGGLSIRPDGLIVLVSGNQIELVDRRTGTVGAPVQLRDVTETRVRPDGSVLTFGTDRRATIIDPETNALVEQAWPVAPFSEVAFGDGRAGVVRKPAGSPEIVDLATGARSTWELSTPDHGPVVPAAAYPDDDGYWTLDDTEALQRWEGDALVGRVLLEGFPATGSRHGDSIAVVVTAAGQALKTVELVDFDPAVLRVVLSIPAPAARTAHPTLDGGVHILDDDGRLHTYDRDGVLVGEMTIEARDLTPLNVPPGRVFSAPISMDASSGRLALPGALGEAVIVDPALRDVRTLPGVDSVSSMAFVRDGELLVIVSTDGTVSLWDDERNQPAGTVWTGSGTGVAHVPWYDEASDSVWVSTSGNLIRIPLDPVRWVERSCQIVGRNLTPEEWDRFVPGDEPPQSACADV